MTMKRLAAAVLLLALAACTPPSSGAEAAVRDIYRDVQENIEQGRITPIDIIPLTDELRQLYDRAEAASIARDEPFIEGDIAANCQDCTSVTDLEIGPQEGPEPIPAGDGHVIVEARFTLNGTEPRAVLYDLVETPQGWRVDNILGEGFNLRSEAAAYLTDAEAGDDLATPAP
jgi:hypothetical protein